MSGAPLPPDEARRQRALDEYEVVDTAAERAYEDIVKLAAYICRTPIALVSLIDRERQWFKARVGLGATETPREQAFCAHAILDPGQLMVVTDAKRDARFAENPLVTGDPNIRFYAGAPLVTATGEALGTLCVIDREPRQLTEEQAEVLRALSRQVMAQLDMRRSIDTLELMASERDEYVDQLEQYQRVLEQEQRHAPAEPAIDPLTGASSRAALERALEDEVARAKRQRVPVSLIVVDIDDFGAYSAQFGTEIAEGVLHQVADILRRSLRPYDVLARYGASAFAILLPATRQRAARVMAERCRRSLEAAVWPHGQVTASLGVARWIEPTQPIELIAAADEAMQRARREGRNRVVAA